MKEITDELKCELRKAVIDVELARLGAKLEHCKGFTMNNKMQHITVPGIQAQMSALFKLRRSYCSSLKEQMPTRAQWDVASPFEKGYMTYMFAAHAKSTIPKKNPFKGMSNEYFSFQEGEAAASIDAQDCP